MVLDPIYYSPFAPQWTFFPVCGILIVSNVWTVSALQFDQFMISSAVYSTGKVRNDFHHHNEYEILFVEDGCVELQVGQKSYTAGPNSLILLANLEQHSLSSHSDVYSRYCVTLHVPVTDSMIQNPDLLNLLKNHSDTFVHCLNVAPIRESISDIFRRLVRCRADEPYGNDLAACYITELLICLSRLYPQLQEQTATTCRSRILAVQKHLDQHFAEPLRIAEICSRYYISPHYLSHQFKNLTGYSPKQYLTLLRLKHAAIEIHDTSDSISEIAFGCGFSDINNFCKQFKREYGCTPSAFRDKKEE